MNIKIKVDNCYDCPFIKNLYDEVHVPSCYFHVETKWDDWEDVPKVRVHGDCPLKKGSVKIEIDKSNNLN